MIATPSARDDAIRVLRDATANFVLIDRALHAAVGSTFAPSRGNFVEFSTEVIIEAAEAFTIQIDGLSILARSAGVHRGNIQDDIASYLGERFDEMAADLIADGVFTLV